MKKLLRLFAITTIALSLVACDHLNTEKPADTPADNTTQNPGTTPSADPAPASNPTQDPTPNPNPSSDPVTPVNKDYFVDSVESVADLDGTVWYAASMFTSQEELAAFDLDDYVTAFRADYYLDFRDNTFWTYYNITFKENIPEDTINTIQSDVHQYFPNDLPMTKNANNNNLTLAIFENNDNNAGDDDDEEESTTTSSSTPTQLATISAVFNDGTITATFPKEFAQSLNLGNGTQDIQLEFTQCYLMFYDGVKLSNVIVPFDIQYDYKFTENTDFYKSGINIDLTNSGMEKYIQSYIDPDEGFEDEETIYFCRYPDEDDENLLVIGFPFPASYIQKAGLMEGTDYSITHNGYFIDLTTVGEEKYNQYEYYMEFYEDPGVYYDQILISEFGNNENVETFLNDFTDDDNNINFTNNTDYKIYGESIALTVSGLTKVLQKEALIYNVEKMYLAVCDDYPTTFVTEEELEELNEYDDYYVAQDDELIVVLSENGYENLDILRSDPGSIVIPDDPDDPDDPTLDDPNLNEDDDGNDGND